MLLLLWLKKKKKIDVPYHLLPRSFARLLSKTPGGVVSTVTLSHSPPPIHSETHSKVPPNSPPLIHRNPTWQGQKRLPRFKSKGHLKAFALQISSVWHDGSLSPLKFTGIHDSQLFLITVLSDQLLLLHFSWFLLFSQPLWYGSTPKFSPWLSS